MAAQLWLRCSGYDAASPFLRHTVKPHTGCSRKNSPIWEANKFETKEDTVNVFFFFLISGKYTEYRFTSTCFEQNITQVAALNIDTPM